MLNSTQASEQLLRQLESSISNLCFDVDLPKLHMTINNGADLSSVQALLGHSDPATTQVYA